jgi:predicted transcriptional regulator
MTAIGSLKKKWRADPAFRRAYDVLKPEFAMARQLIAARHRAGLSQAEVARKMGTTQSTVARLESGQRLPTMSTLQRYASAIGHKVQVHLIEASR